MIILLMIVVGPVNAGAVEAPDAEAQWIYYRHFECLSNFERPGDLHLELEEVRNKNGEIINGLLSPDHGDSWIRVEMRQQSFSGESERKVVVWRTRGLTVRGFFLDPRHQDVFQAEVHLEGRDSWLVECHLTNG